MTDLRIREVRGIASTAREQSCSGVLSGVAFAMRFPLGTEVRVAVQLSDGAPLPETVDAVLNGIEREVRDEYAPRIARSGNVLRFGFGLLFRSRGRWSVSWDAGEAAARVVDDAIEVSVRLRFVAHTSAATLIAIVPLERIS